MSGITAISGVSLLPPLLILLSRILGMFFSDMRRLGEGWWIERGWRFDREGEIERDTREWGKGSVVE